MYYLFCNHDWPPSVYFDAHETDKAVIRAFVQEEERHYEELKESMKK